jgi:beta-glucosidase
MTDSGRPAFRNPDLPADQRITDLLDRLSLDEKIGLLHQYHAPVERLGLGAFKTGTEALHGLAWLGEATVFPQVVGLGATWNPELVESVGAAVADEVLAFHHNDPVKVGRNVWAPTVNPLRDPRWGRNEEGYSEDAWMTGVMGAAYARGLKSEEDGVWKTAPTLKHFLAYNNETDRCTTSSNLPPRVLHEYEFTAHRPALASGDAVAVMLSYNLVNGRPAHVSPLVNSDLRTWASDEVFVVSDAYAPNNLAGLQEYFEDLPTAYAHAIKAGLDSFTQDDDRPGEVLGHVRAALERGLIDESDIDTAARRNLYVRFGLGEFDPEDRFAHIGDEVVDSEAHRALAREAATQSITLLKNDGILPLAAPKTIAVIGQLADTVMADWYSGTLPYAVTARAALAERAEVIACEAVDRIRVRHKGGYLAAAADGAAVTLQDTAGEASQWDLLDWGGGSFTLRSVATGKYLRADKDTGHVSADSVGPHEFDVVETFRLVQLDGGKIVIQQVHKNEGAETGRWLGLDADGRVAAVDALDEALSFDAEYIVKAWEEAMKAAAAADVAIVVLGDHPLANGRETEDRTDLYTPETQHFVLMKTLEANPNTVLVMSSSYPYSVEWPDRHVPAVVWSAHGGQEWGNALADVLFGDRDPEGRLPQTWYIDAAELPALLDYDIIASDATYMYYLGSPLYAFGHGLSYTDFTYANLAVDHEQVRPGDELTVTVDVTNSGDRPGVEVVQLYTHQCGSRVKQPLRQLRAFQKIRLEARETRTVTFTLAVDDFAHWDNVTGRMIVEKSRQRLMVGRSATDIALSAAVRVDGETVGARDLANGALRADSCDGYSGVLWRDEDRVSGDVIAAKEPGGWIMLGDCDFRDGAYASVTARVAGAASQLTLRADDPLDGDVLAKVDTPATSGVYDYVDVSADFGRPEGVGDLYVTFESGGVRLASLTFGQAE